MSPRKLRFGSSAIALVVLAFLGFQWSLSTEAAWLRLLAAGAFSTVVVDAAWARWSLRRPQVTCSTPTDGIVGTSQPVLVHVERPAGRLQLRMSSLERAPWVVLDAPARGSIDVEPEHRGVYRDAELDLFVVGPLGLVGAQRKVDVVLPNAIVIGPRPVPVPEPVNSAPDGDDGDQRARAGRGDLVRGAREYRPGDPWRVVHWPATARSGVVMVRELEAPTAATVVVVVDLGPDEDDAAEETAGRASWLVQALLRRGCRVELVTREDGGVRRETVTAAIDASRRLARCLPGEPMGRESPGGGGRAGVPRGQVVLVSRAGVAWSPPA